VTLKSLFLALITAIATMVSLLLLVAAINRPLDAFSLAAVTALSAGAGWITLRRSKPNRA
jgi:membrane protein implicated in regulation of membrane protease activity